MALADTRQLCSLGPVFVHAHRTDGGVGSEGREGANGIRIGIGVGGGNGDENEGVKGHVTDDGDGKERGRSGNVNGSGGVK